jgi:hypothetical protein
VQRPARNNASKSRPPTAPRPRLTGRARAKAGARCGSTPARNRQCAFAAGAAPASQARFGNAARRAGSEAGLLGMAPIRGKPTAIRHDRHTNYDHTHHKRRSAAPAAGPGASTEHESRAWGRGGGRGLPGSGSVPAKPRPNLLPPVKMCGTPAQTTCERRSSKLASTPARGGAALFHSFAAWPSEEPRRPKARTAWTRGTGAAARRPRWGGRG